ncbi:MAG: hypothetical protein ACREJO_00510 [Phycisphaerales bacterium]
MLPRRSKLWRVLRFLLAGAIVALLLANIRAYIVEWGAKSPPPAQVRVWVTSSPFQFEDLEPSEPIGPIPPPPRWFYLRGTEWAVTDTSQWARITCTAQGHAAFPRPTQEASEVWPWWLRGIEDDLPSATEANSWSIHITADAFGWPLPCAASCSGRDRLSTMTQPAVLRGALWLTRPGLDDTRVPMVWPTSILWRGLLADAVVLGTGLWILSLGLTALRARWRSARNRCPRCAYLRAGLTPTAPCPECGPASSTRRG